MDDTAFLKLAIENSKRSGAEGNFPAGAIVVLNNEIAASAISAPFPGLLHADSKAVTAAFDRKGPLNGATLYVGMQPCLMCTGVAYWAGIRRIVYAIPKTAVSGTYYETPADTQTLIDGFNEKIEFLHISDLEAEAMAIVRTWESRNGL